MAYELGIDVGTTFIGAAIRRDGTTSPLALGQRGQVAPSAVLLTADGTFLVGDAAERAAAGAPERLARLFKRRFGDATPIVLGGVAVPVDRLVSEVVRWVVGLATTQEGAAPAGVVLTHPAEWGAHRLEAFRAAAAAAYGGPVRLLSEPEAAAAHYIATRRAPARLVVFDLGGGTFDVAVLGLDGEGRYRHLVEPEGIDDMGGADVDDAVLAHLLTAAHVDLDAVGDDASVQRDVALLRRSATEAKEALSFDSRAAVDVRVGDQRQLVTLTRSELEDAVRPQLSRTAALVQRLLGRLPPEPETTVLLTGGASRMPLVAELVTGETGLPCAVDADPKLAVALGALESADEVTTPAPTAAPAPPPEPQPLPEPMVAIGTGEPAGRRRAPVVGALVVAVALVIAAVLALGGGGGDGDDELADDATTTTDEPTTTTEEPTTTTAVATTTAPTTPTAADLQNADISGTWRLTTNVTECSLENCGPPDYTLHITCDANLRCSSDWDAVGGDSSPVVPSDVSGVSSNGTMPENLWITCGGTPFETIFAIDEIQATRAVFRDGAWRASALAGVGFLGSGTGDANCGLVSMQFSFAAA